MALTKQPININFAQGLDTKTDPKQVSPGNFLDLENSIFDKTGMLQKRNGFGALTTLPDETSTNLTTFNGNLLSIGNSIEVLSEDNQKWYNKGVIQPVTVSTIPMVRDVRSQSTVDAALDANGLTITAWTDNTGASYYQIVDSQTGQNIINHVLLPSSATSPRVFVLGRFFIVTFAALISATMHLQYIAIPIGNPLAPLAATDFSTVAGSGASSGYDGYVVNNNLYLAYADSSGSMRVTYIDSSLVQHNTVVSAGFTANLVSVTADITTPTPTIWVAINNSGTNTLYAAAYNAQLVPILGYTTVSTSGIDALTSAASGNVLTVYYEVANSYSYNSVRSDYIAKTTLTIGGTASSPIIVSRAVGLASKAFFFPLNGMNYFLAVYSGALQPSYFLMDENGNIISKLAYSNATGYAATQVLPSVTLQDDTAFIGYLYRDQLTPVNKAQGAPAVNGVYTAAGINLATFTINNSGMIPVEIANDLHLTGGFLWMYDGVKPVELGFNVFPEDIAATPSTTGGDMTAQLYYYYVTYEWTDAQGNIHRSAPSVPLAVTTTSATSSVLLDIPTLRLTYKVAPNPVRIVIYRWSVGQQIPYQVTPVLSPLINDPTVDFLTYTDTFSDAEIIGDLILYTNGGVIEDIGPPACTTASLFKSRLFLVDAEDQNLLWYSKQVIEAVPVEMSDLFTIYVAPTTSAQGSTGFIKALAPLDDKLIMFKKDAIYYLTGNGPDNTGANNDFSDPIFITGTVGCDNQKSIVLIPNGLIFQSDKGFWLLDRTLQTSYIGAPVEAFNAATVLSAVNVPATNQVRFTLDSGITLMYDYYFNQWGTFTNIPAISSTVYQSLHTYLNAFGQVFQESPGAYLDGSSPVLMKFVTGWMNLAGLQGYERFYAMYILGQYITPFKINVQFAYDYNPNPLQSVLVTPDNFTPNWGGEQLWGSGDVWGGVPGGGVFPARVFPEKQKCESFQVIMTEVYDSTYGVPAGAGLTLSGLNLVVGMKKGYRVSSAARSFG